MRQCTWCNRRILSLRLKVPSIQVIEVQLWSKIPLVVSKIRSGDYFIKVRGEHYRSIHIFHI